MMLSVDWTTLRETAFDMRQCSVVHGGLCEHVA